MKLVDLNGLESDEVSSSYFRQMAHGDTLTVAKVEVHEGEVTQAHSHDSEEVIFVLKGAWRFHLPDGEVIVRSNQMLFIPPGVEHSSEVLEDTIAIDICSKARSDWQSGTDKSLHSNPGQNLWAV